MRLGWMWVTFGLAACGSNNNRGADAGGGPNSPDAAMPDASTPDASVPDASMPDAAVPLVDVHGVAADLHFSSPTAITTVPEDLSAHVIQAYVPDSSPFGFRVIDAGPKTTSFTIPGVPDGSYYLLDVAPGDPVPHFYQTTSRSLDLGVIVLGRVDGPIATQPTTLTLHLTGAAPPGQTSDFVFIDSFSTGGETFAILDQGQTSLDPFPLDWRDMGGVPLLDAAKGDDLFVCQQRQEPGAQAGSLQRTIVDAFSTRALTLADGQGASVTGMFDTPFVTGTQVFQIAPASYRAGHDVPIHQPFLFNVRLRAGLTGAFSQGPPVADLLQIVGASQQQLIDSVSFRDPFPADWPRFLFATPVAQWNYAARGATQSTSYTATTFSRTLASPFVQVTPPFAAPHAIKVGGVASSEARAVPFDGTHAVTIEWSPVVGVTHYTVRAQHLTSSGSSSTLTTIATFDTTTSAATMPPSLFEVGESYVFAVASVVDPTTDYLGGVLRRQGFPVSSHDAVTARLLFAASCGNTVVDAPFEQCDSGGIATDRCNPDCTQPICGDGFANAPAGEACDDAGDSLVCNPDCTPAACGDGHVHIQVNEFCDDGNLRDGDGCSSDCLIEPGFHCTGEPSVCTRGPAISRAGHTGRPR